MLQRVLALVLAAGVLGMPALGQADAGNSDASGPDSPIWELSTQARQSTLEAGGKIVRSTGSPFDLLSGAADTSQASFEALRAVLVDNATRSTREMVGEWQERDRRMQQLQQQLQSAMPPPAPVDGVPTEQQIAWAEYQTRQANLNALNAAQTQGFQQGLVEARKKSAEKQVDMALDTVSSWKPPKTYGAQAAGLPGLEDPFASKPEKAFAASGELAETLRGSCLSVDEERGVAVVAQSCDADDCLRGAQPGDYPFLDDGRLIDSGGVLEEFRAACASQPPLVLRDGSQLVALEKAS